MRALTLTFFLLTALVSAQAGTSIGDSGAYVQCYQVASESSRNDQTKETITKTGNTCVVVYRGKHYQLVLYFGLAIVLAGLGIAGWQVYNQIQDKTNLRKELERATTELQEITSGRAPSRGWELASVGDLISKILEAIGKLAGSLTALPGSTGLFLIILGGLVVWVALNSEVRILTIEGNVAPITTETAPR